MVELFLSHTSADKPFARELRATLNPHQVNVWVDEYEIRVGESLISKISDRIRESDFLGVVLSPDSVPSEWVQREVNIALTEEISNAKVKVLPILYRECEIPPFLWDKLYADFTFNFNAGVVSLLRGLGKDVTPIVRAVDRHGPYVLEFSVDDWNVRTDEPGFVIQIPQLVHGKTASAVTVQQRIGNRWQDCECDVQTTDADDVEVGALTRFSGRIVVR